MELNIKTGTPAKGKLLISEPFLLDPSFSRTVVFLTEHADEGTVGYVLNRPMESKINDTLAEFPDFDAPLFIGGPVQPNTLHFLHTMGDVLEDSIEVFEGLWWGGNFDTLQSMIETDQVSAEEIKFFIGYSGWDSGQLDEEIKEKSWIVADVSIEEIFAADTTNMWQNVLKKMGSDYRVISNFPEDPRLN